MTALVAAARLVVTMLKTGAPEYDARDVLEVLEAALAEPEPEPVAWQWLDTSTFRARLHERAVLAEWRPLYARESPGLMEGGA